jgi:hypothetical protein
VGQHVTAMKVMAAAAAGQDLAREVAGDAKLARFLARPGTEALLPHLRALGCELPPDVLEVIRELLGRRAIVLAERRERREQTPDVLRHERAGIDTQLLVLYAALVRRLWQRAESLPYLNDRPYSLSLYLLFGPELLQRLAEQPTIALESVTERQPDLRAGCSCC